MKRSEIRQKIAGAVYGFVIGDAMGATTEFMVKDKIEEKFGVLTDIVGGGWLNLEKGDVTDDSQMTMCVMDSLMELGPDVNYMKFKHDVAKRFEQWLDSNPPDVGNACRAGILAYKRSNHSEFTKVDNRVLGNGSLMRAMPCAIMGLDKLNKAQGEITHNNEECARGIQMYSEALRVHMMGIFTLPLDKKLQKPSGYLWDTFNNAMHWASMPTFEECIIGAVNDGGDADTIAAIAGSLAGARFGLDAIPARWIGPIKVDVKAKIGKFINFANSYLQSVEDGLE